MAETQPDIAQYQSDHDVLIELRTEMRGMRGDIKDLKDATADKTTDHEMRLRTLESQRWMIAGGVTVISAIIGYALQIFL